MENCEGSPSFAVDHTTFWEDCCDSSALLYASTTWFKAQDFGVTSCTDVARMACVSSRMQSLCSNNDLWKRGFSEEFGRALKTEILVIGKQTKKNNTKETRPASYLQDFFDLRDSWTSQFRPSLSILNNYYMEKEISRSSSNCKFLDINVFC